MPFDRAAIRGYGKHPDVDFNCAFGPGAVLARDIQGSTALRRWAEANHLDTAVLRSFAIRADVMYVTYYAVRDRKKRENQAASGMLAFEEFDQDIVVPLPDWIVAALGGWRDNERQ